MTPKKPAKVRMRQHDFVQDLHWKNSRRKNLYQSLLELRREKFSKIERLKEVRHSLSEFHKGFLPSAEFSRKASLLNERKALFSRLTALGFEKAELERLLRTRKNQLAEFSRMVSKKLGSLANTPARKARLAEIKQEVSSWNFVNPENPADVDFHALIEVRGLQLLREW